MDIVTAMSIAGVATLGTELMISSIVSKCLISRLNRVTDKILDLVYILGQLGLGEATTPPATISASTSLSSIQQRKAYQDLMAMDLIGQLNLIVAILEDRKKIVCNVHPNGKPPMVIQIINDYKGAKGAECGQDPSEEDCTSPMCNSATLNTALDQLAEISDSIYKVLVPLVKEHERYNNAWFAILHDDVYFAQLKILLPILKQRKQDLFDSMVFCNLIVASSSTPNRYNSSNHRNNHQD